MRRTLVLLLLAASFLFFNTAFADQAGTVALSASSLPIQYHATCAAAGGFVLEFTSGTFINSYSQITVTLDEGVVLCHDIDLEISPGGETSSWTGSLASEGNIPPSGAPVTDPTQTSTSQGGGVYFRVLGDAGSNEIRIMVDSSFGTASLIVGSGANDKIILHILTQETNAADFQAQPGIYTDPDHNEAYTQAATAAENTLFINTTEWSEQTVDAHFISVENFTFVPSTVEIAHTETPPPPQPPTYRVTGQSSSPLISCSSRCGEAGDIMLSFDSGAVIRPGDYFAIYLEPEVTLCKNIDLEISAGGSGAPWSGAAAQGGNIPASGAPLTDSGQRSKATGNGIYFHVTGSQGSNKVKVTARGSDDDSLTVGYKSSDRLVLEVLTKKTNTAGYSSRPGVYIRSEKDGNYSVPATRQDTTLCIDISQTDADTVLGYLSCGNNFEIEPYYLKVARLSEPVSYHLHLCSDTGPGQIAVPDAADQDCFSFGYETGIGYIPETGPDNASRKLIIQTGSENTFFSPADYQIELKILTAGVFWSNDPVCADEYATAVEACSNDPAQTVVGSQTDYQYWTSSGQAATPAALGGSSSTPSCSGSGDASTLRINCDAVISGSNVAALSIKLPRLTGDPSAVTIGSEVLVRIAMFGCSCTGQIFNAAISLGVLASQETGFHAVIVGISDYPASNSDLTHADDDARDLASSLLAFPNWKSENIQLLLNENASVNAIVSAITAMGSQASANDTCLFFFSGLGSNLHNSLTPNESNPGAGALAAYDGMLSYDEIAAALAGLPSKSVVSIVDASHGGSPLLDAVLSRGRIKCLPRFQSYTVAGDELVADLSVNNQAKGLTVSSGVTFSASNDDALAWEFDRLQHGLLTYALIRAIQTFADTNEAAELSAEALGTATMKTFENLYSQYPKLYDVLQQMPAVHDAYPPEAPASAEIPLLIKQQ